MSHPVPPVTGFRRHGRNALIGMTAAGLILGGPSVAFAAEAPAPESTGTFGQEVLPAAGEAATTAPTGYPVVQEVASQVIASETALICDSDRSPAFSRYCSWAMPSRQVTASGSRAREM